MSRYTKDQNKWGAGNLNGTPSATKSNGEHGKRYGALGIGGVGGVVRKNGSEHEIIYELSGQEVLTENGAPAAGVLRVELPDSVGLIESATIKVQEGFAATSAIMASVTAQANAGDGAFVVTPMFTAAAPLDAVGIFDVPLAIGVGPVYEEGGSMTVDFAGVIAGAGKAELIIKYTSL
jgi:hypothetical protein